MQFSNEQRIVMVTVYLQTGSLRRVQAAFKQQFSERVSPSKPAILQTVNKYRTKGTILN